MAIVSEIASPAVLNLTNVHVVVSRAEDHTVPKYDYMLGRAVAAIPTFLGFSSHLIRTVDSRDGIEIVKYSNYPLFYALFSTFSELGNKIRSTFENIFPSLLLSV